MRSLFNPGSSRLLPLLVLALLVAVAVGPSLRGGFVWDDAPLIVDNSMVKDPGQIGRILTSSFWETARRIRGDGR